MSIEKLLKHLEKDNTVIGGTDAGEVLDLLADEAMRITAELNNSYHSPEEVRDIFSRLTGNPVDESFKMFPPFFTECGKNIHVGKNVFINFCCHFQDQGGVYIGDDVLIGSNVVFATINHGMDPDERHLHHLESHTHREQGLDRFQFYCAAGSHSRRWSDHSGRSCSGEGRAAEDGGWRRSCQGDKGTVTEEEVEGREKIKNVTKTR